MSQEKLSQIKAQVTKEAGHASFYRLLHDVSYEDIDKKVDQIAIKYAESQQPDLVELEKKYYKKCTEVRDKTFYGVSDTYTVKDVNVFTKTPEQLFQWLKQNWK